MDTAAIRAAWQPGSLGHWHPDSPQALVLRLCGECERLEQAARNAQARSDQWETVAIRQRGELEQRDARTAELERILAEYESWIEAAMKVPPRRGAAWMPPASFGQWRRPGQEKNHAGA